MKHPIHIKTYREQEVVYDADNDMFFVINNKSLSGVTCQSFKEIKEQIDNYVDGELSVSLSTERATRLLQDGSWKLIPVEPDILAQLRDVLGWKEGSLEDVLEVLQHARTVIGCGEDEQYIALYDLESAINKNKSV